MSTETPMQLRRAVIHRHRPEAGAFWAGLLRALTAAAADAEQAVGVVQGVLASGCFAVSPQATLSRWLQGLGEACGADPAVLSAHVGGLARALDDIDAAARQSRRQRGGRRPRSWPGIDIGGEVSAARYDGHRM